MEKTEIQLLCTDERCGQRESLYIFECKNRSDSPKTITNIQLITNGDISNKELGEILKNLIKLNKKQNKLGYLDPGLFQSGTSV